MIHLQRVEEYPRVSILGSERVEQKIDIDDLVLSEEESSERNVSDELQSMVEEILEENSQIDEVVD